MNREHLLKSLIRKFEKRNKDRQNNLFYIQILHIFLRQLFFTGAESRNFVLLGGPGHHVGR